MQIRTLLILMSVSNIFKAELDAECIFSQFISYVKKNALKSVNKHTDPNDSTIRILESQGSQN